MSPGIEEEDDDYYVAVEEDTQMSASLRQCAVMKFNHF
jgi:hypothetical protein